jgi:putative DNA primase/helicase
MGLSDTQALKDLARRFNVDAPKKQHPSANQDQGQGNLYNRRRPQEAEKEVPQASLEEMPLLGGEWIKRLEKIRGWSPSVIQDLGLRLWTPPKWADDPMKRVDIPIYDEKHILRNVRLYRLGGDPTNKVISFWSGFGADKVSYGRPARIWPAIPPRDIGDNSPLWMVEGEPDCICARSHGLDAHTATGGAGTWRKDWIQRFKDRDVIICYDADLPGIVGALKVARQIASVAASVWILIWPEAMTGADPAADDESDAKLRAKALDQAPDSLSEYIRSLPPKHGQDLTDFFVKHAGSVEQLQELAGKAERIKTPEQEEYDYMDEEPGPWRFFKRSKTGKASFKPVRLAEEILQDMDIVTDAETGLSYTWTGQVWKELNPRFIHQQALKKLEDEATNARAMDAAAQAGSLSLLPHGTGMNPDPYLLCLQNGVLDVRTLEVQPFSREQYITYQLPVNFNLADPAPCDGWKLFLKQSAKAQEVAFGELQEFYGYCFWPTNRWRKALMLQGPKRSGKSTCLNILQHLVGMENVSNVDLVDLEDQFLRSSLYGRMLNVFDEIDGKLMSSKYFKSISSGGRITAAFKHQNSFEFVPRCKLAFSCNRLPVAYDKSDGFYDRLLIVRFEKSYTKEDPHLEERLISEELDGIFAWAMLGLHRLVKRGDFALTDTSKFELEEYQRETNPVQAFVEEKCSTEPQYKGHEVKVSKDELYSAYKAFCKARGYGVRHYDNFAAELRALLPEIGHSRRRTDEGRLWYWVGLRLDPDA